MPTTLRFVWKAEGQEGHSLTLSVPVSGCGATHGPESTAAGAGPSGPNDCLPQLPRPGECPAARRGCSSGPALPGCSQEMPRAPIRPAWCRGLCLPTQCGQQPSLSLLTDPFQFIKLTNGVIDSFLRYAAYLSGGAELDTTAQDFFLIEAGEELKDGCYQIPQ